MWNKEGGTTFRIPQKWIAQEMFIGDSIYNNEKITSFTLDYPFVWKPITPAENITVEQMLKPYNQNTMSFPINNDLTLTLSELPLYSNNTYRNVRQVLPVYELKSNNPISLKEMHDHYLMINSFFGICYNRAIYPSSIYFLTDSKKNFQYFPYWVHAVKYVNMHNIENTCLIPYQYVFTCA